MYCNTTNQQATERAEVYLTVSCHVSFHATVSREHHVTQTADVLFHTTMSSNVSLQYTARYK